MERQPQALTQSLERILGKFEVFDGSLSINQKHLRLAIAHTKVEAGRLAEEVESVFQSRENDLLSVCQAMTVRDARQASEAREVAGILAQVEAAKEVAGETLAALRQKRDEEARKKEISRFLGVFDRWEKAISKFEATARKMREKQDFRPLAVGVLAARFRNLHLWKKETEDAVARSHSLATPDKEEWSRFACEREDEAGDLAHQVFEGWAKTSPTENETDALGNFEVLSRMCRCLGGAQKIAEMVRRALGEAVANKRDLDGVREALRQEYSDQASRLSKALGEALALFLEPMVAGRSPTESGESAAEATLQLLQLLRPMAAQLMEGFKSTSAAEVAKPALVFVAQVQPMLKGLDRKDPEIAKITEEVGRVLDQLRDGADQADLSDRLGSVVGSLASFEGATESPKEDFSLKSALEKVQKAPGEFTMQVSQQLSLLLQAPSFGDPRQHPLCLRTLLSLLCRLDGVMGVVGRRVAAEETDLAREWAIQFLKVWTEWLDKALASLSGLEPEGRGAQVRAALAALAKRTDDQLLERRAAKKAKKPESRKGESLFSTLKSKLSIGLPKAA